MCHQKVQSNIRSTSCPNLYQNNNKNIIRKKSVITYLEPYYERFIYNKKIIRDELNSLRIDKSS